MIRPEHDDADRDATPHRSHPILTLEELEALLRQPEAPPPAAGDEATNVLVVGKQDDDIELLGRVLAEYDVSVSVARNPFTALDHLRARVFRLVFSDAEAWAARGPLLFERIARLDYEVGVVSICDAEPGKVEAARRSPAVRVLVRPLDERDVHDAIRELLAGVERTRDAGSDASEPSDPEPVEASDSLDARAAEGAPEADPELPAARTESGAPPDAARWHRFFFDARRQLRPIVTVEARRQRLLELLVEMRGGAVALLGLARDPQGKVAVRVLGLKSSVASAERDALKDALQESIARVREEFAVAGVLHAVAARNGTLTVPLAFEAGRCQVLLAVAPRRRGAAPVSEEVADDFREELARLLAELATPSE